ncbi:hypothetical protein PoB_003300500 [Plakobranchus ocellatus]|uniref:Uncharacterized protein n=1 Tax=Plakobranchus ocellatus TaxID=259542 RepID=A0AAV4AGL2_9GAST|nr:hypothetical protein PoB_003300500 [Plakobranchus ocellatus]
MEAGWWDVEDGGIKLDEEANQTRLGEEADETRLGAEAGETRLGAEADRSRLNNRGWWEQVGFEAGGTILGVGDE